MGNAAENERLKLKATFYNNLSVGLFLGGLLIPYLSLVQHAGSIIERLTDVHWLTFVENGNAIASILAMVLALQGGKGMRRLADKTIALIQDEEAKISS
jgi:hypothetical protein